MLEQKKNATLLTPLGKRCPQISAPPSGTILPKVKPVAGWILRLSLSTAWRYGSFCASAKVEGLDRAPEE